MPEEAGTEEQGSTEQESGKAETSDDIFADARAEDAKAQSEKSVDGKAVESTTTETQEKQPYKFGDTPYESEEAAIKGYKELQGSHTRNAAELAQLKEQMAKVVGSLKTGDGQEKGQMSPEEVDKFLKAFISNPHGTMRELIQAVAQEQLAPIRSEIATGRAGVAVTKFQSDHPELTKDDEAKLEQILLNNPQLTNLGNNPSEASITASLQSALGMFIAQDPAGYATKLASSKNKVEQDVNEAKKAAGAVGGKKGSLVSTPGKEGDAFDEVLEQDYAFKRKYAGAKK